MKEVILKSQKNEITEYHIYSKLAKQAKGKNKKVLEHIAKDELRHYEIMKKFTKQDVKPNMIRVWWYIILAKILGVAFSLKLMEKGEELAQEVYKNSGKKILKDLWREEQVHEKKILRMLEDEKVEYAGSIVLGLNDALVELTGALAGMTLALQNTKIIAVIGFITGFAASLSMAASGYLSSREDSSEKNPIKGAIYTGVAYIIVVILLILPYMLLDNHWLALGIMLSVTILVIAGYTFYISVAKEKKFWRRFIEMALISLGVAAISYGLGILLRTIFNIEI